MGLLAILSHTGTRSCTECGDALFSLPPGGQGWRHGLHHAGVCLLKRARKMGHMTGPPLSSVLA
eukprot:6484394-Amphidinium_carterae.2